MPISTNLNQAPYFNDFSKNKGRYRILFQPTVSVQTRELNELQSIFQNQIEMFGDNIFATGSIVSGCNFTVNPNTDYVKLNDIGFNGESINPSLYLGYTALNETTGLRARVINFSDGFESTSPNLKTIYLTYKNAGDVGNLVSFSSGDILRIYDSTMNGIESIEISGGGVGFSNTDTVIASQSIVVTITSGTLANNDYLVNGLGANVQIIGFDNTTLSNSNQIIVTVAPRVVDLINATATTNAWTFTVNDTITNPAATLTGYINFIIGNGFVGKVITTGTGVVQAIDVLQKGIGYTTVPYITIQSRGGISGNYSGLNLLPRNYIAKPIVSSLAQSVGQGYAFTVSEGVIYQKGTFVQSAPQTLMVEKYSTTPDNVAVGFCTNEQIIDYNIDSTLLDNVNNTTNQQAPGANRLKLIPSLYVTTSELAATNNEFLVLAQWKNGRIYKQNQQTVYSIIGDNIAQRVYDQSGDFVIDPWLVTTRSPLSGNNEGAFVDVVVDPGKGYIQGQRVETISNYNIEVDKGFDTAIVNNHFISMNYGNFVKVKEVGGAFFGTDTGASVNLYDTATSFLTNYSSGTISPSGAIIGTANIRNAVLDSGIPGTSGAIYRLYLFNVTMNTGRNFRDVRGIAQSTSAIGDTIIELNGTTGNFETILHDTEFNGLVFPIGVETLKNANNITYTYRSVGNGLTLSNTGIASKDISGSPNEFFPYSAGPLTSGQMAELIITNTDTVDLVTNTTPTGTVTANNTSPNLVGSSTSFTTQYAAGDFLTIAANSIGGSDLRRIVNVVNNTLVILNANCSYSNTVAVVYRTFPKKVAIPFGYRSGLSANVNVNKNVLTLNFGMNFSFSGTKTVATATNIQKTAATQETKTANRKKFILICCGNNAGSNVGPWSLGVADAFRLRGVYIGTAAVANTGTNYVRNFFIDPNQHVDYYGLSTLNLRAGNPVAATLNANSYLLVEFDHFTSSAAFGGFYDTVSYLSSNTEQIFINDSLPLASLGSNTINSFEVPELFDSSGEEIDLLNQVDFRYYVANTVNPSAVYSTAPLNPNSAVTFDTGVEKKFPFPDSQFYAGQIEYYLGRTDSVFIDPKAVFSVVRGVANAAITQRHAPVQPTNTLKLTDILIPAYPNLPINHSMRISQILNTGIDSGAHKTTRNLRKTINNRGLDPGPSFNANNVLPFVQPRNYLKSDIGEIDRRLKSVEYEVALSAMEADVSSMVIPSSIDPSTNRFKYGFFVDNFKTTDFMDLNNPQYYAAHDPTNLDVTPPRMEWDVGVFGTGVPDWADAPIISQPIATVGGIADPQGLGPVCAINLSNTVAYQTFFRNASDVIVNGTASNTDVVNITFASNTSLSSTVNFISTPLSTWLAQNPGGAPWKGHLAPGILGPGLTTQAALAAALGVQFQNEFISGTTTQGGDVFSYVNQQAFNLINNFALSGANTSSQAYTDMVDQLSQMGINAGNVFKQNLPTADQIAGTGNNPSEWNAQLWGQTHGTTVTTAWLNLVFSNPYTPLQPNEMTSMPSGGTFVSTVYQPPVTLYFYNYNMPAKITIYQNNILVATTDTAAVGVAIPANLNQADINLLEGPAAQFWFNDHPELYMQNFIDTGGGQVKFAGKLTFNYNPQAGTQFTIKVDSPNSFRWRYVLAYPVNGSSVGCIPPQTTRDVKGYYVGTYQDYITIGGQETVQTIPPPNNSADPTILIGYTQVWNPQSPINATTSVVPFDITLNFH